MFTLLKLTRMSSGKVGLTIQLDGTKGYSADRLAAFLNWITADFKTGDTYHVAETPLDQAIGEHPAQGALFIPTRLPWLTATQSINDSGPNRCGKCKSAYMTKGFSVTCPLVTGESLTRSCTERSAASFRAGGAPTPSTCPL